MVQAQHDQLETYEEAPDHPSPESKALATVVLTNAYKAFFSNDPKEIYESARFFADTSEDGVLHFWMSILNAADPQGSSRMQTLSKLGRSALFTCYQANNATRNITDKNKKKKEWLRMFHSTKRLVKPEDM